MNDNTDIKKTSDRPADPVIITPDIAVEPPPEQLRLQAFEDGYIFKFTPHPTEPGRFVLFDTRKQPIGVIGSAPIADLICQAVRMLFDAVRERNEQQPIPHDATSRGATDKVIDAEVVEDARAPDNVVPLPGVITLPPNNIVPLVQDGAPVMES